MSYTLGQAAKAVGRSKPTIARAIKSGKISAERTATGEFAIDPAELHRVFQLASNGVDQLLRSVPGERDGASLVELLAERERLVTEQAETIRQLWHRIEADAEERRRLMALLTGPERVAWWRRWFR
jgi:excisionase family DNA binding protein